MSRIAAAALAYWSAVFALAFVIGALRVGFVPDGMPRALAVLAEVPLVLAFSWLAARAMLRRFGVARGGPALAMGALAFALLMAAELALAMTIAGQTPGQWLAAMMNGVGLIGLAGQIGFGLMPWAAARRG